MKRHKHRKGSQRFKGRWSLLVGGAFVLFLSGSAIAAFAPGGINIGNIVGGDSGSVPDFGSGGIIQDTTTGSIGLPDFELPDSPWETPGDWGSGSNILGDLFKDLFEISQQESDIFGVLTSTVLGEVDILRGKETPNPFELRLPEKNENSGNPRESEESKVPGILTSSEIVRRRDFANLYDQTLARSAAAPYLGEEGVAWLNTEVEAAAEIMTKAGENVAKAGTTAEAAQELTSTQDVLKETTQVNALIANQMAIDGELQAEGNESLLAIQRIGAISAALAANNGEALDEANRRSRFTRSVMFSDAASSSMTLLDVGLRDTVSPAENASTQSRSPIGE